ncbi:hypothetical protein TorRG33x02_076530 [Trema orientale]|uniref:Uncharacterized protein n=1 Tax=Trema orientale TaxID=63057 RepID=A0A2P5FFX7_TREOI|nr:hypothetical protein TorRG33x02_076530 [Trema orientale]
MNLSSVEMNGHLFGLGVKTHSAATLDSQVAWLNQKIRVEVLWNGDWSVLGGKVQSPRRWCIGGKF